MPHTNQFNRTQQDDNGRRTQIAKLLRQLGCSRRVKVESADTGSVYGPSQITSDNPAEILCVTQQHLGFNRESQEDSAMTCQLHSLSYPSPLKLHMSILCDGCGGNEGGELASMICTKVMARNICTELLFPSSSALGLSFLNRLEVLQECAFEAANAAILQHATANPQLHGMASTCVCAIVVGKALCVAWAGDSRFYRLRAGVLTQLTTDHNIAQCLVSDGILAPEEAHNHPGRNRLTKALGANAEIFPEVLHEQVMPEDLFLLTSDGFHEGLTPEEISQTCQEHLSRPVTLESIRALAGRLETMSLDGYGQDNLTAVFMYIQPPQPPGGSATTAAKANHNGVINERSQ